MDFKWMKSGETRAKKNGNYEHFRETSKAPSLGVPRLVQGPGGGLDQDPGEHLQELDQRQPEGDGAHPGRPQHRLLRRSQVRYTSIFLRSIFIVFASAADVAASNSEVLLSKRLHTLFLLLLLLLLLSTYCSTPVDSIHAVVDLTFVRCLRCCL